MAFRVDFTEVAIEDLDCIAAFISVDDPAAASRICGQLYNCALSLGANPFMGRVTPDYSDLSIRDFVQGKYRIVYLVYERQQRLEILRFWHGARGFLEHADL